VLEGLSLAEALWISGSGHGASGASFGLPRFRTATFQPRFPFAAVSLQDREFRFRSKIVGWNP